MNKYQVYLTTNETIYIQADEFTINCDYGIVRFVKDNHKNAIAVFTLSNICGFEKVDEFDYEGEEDENDKG